MAVSEDYLWFALRSYLISFHLSKFPSLVRLFLNCFVLISFVCVERFVGICCFGDMLGIGDTIMDLVWDYRGRLQ